VRDPLGVAIDLCIGEVLQKLTRSSGVIEVNVGEKDMVDPVDSGLFQPLHEVRDGGSRSRVYEKRHPVDPIEPCADELPEPLEGLIDIDQVKVVANLLNGNRSYSRRFMP